MYLKHFAALILGTLAWNAYAMPVDVPEDAGMCFSALAGRRRDRSLPTHTVGVRQLSRRRFKWDSQKHCIDKSDWIGAACYEYEPGYDPNLPEDEDY